RQGLLIVPPRFIDGTVNDSRERRYMLVVDCFESDDGTKIISLVNLTKYEGKAGRIFRSDYVLITRHNPPFPKISFAKTEGIYNLEYFTDLDKLLLADGQLLHEIDFNDVIEELESPKIVSFSEQEIRKVNRSLI
ncbi:MAG: hypothetical protein FWH46_04310, partial [Methanimicrococcus sp.]|nr:hypothetical protein [Methanimicrococcus sp.]